MIDINDSFSLDNQADVMAWIHAAEFKSRSRFGRPVSHPGTIYWNKRSRRWAIKVYSKYNELVHGGKAHRLPDSLGLHAPDLIEWSSNILRIELRLLSKELQLLNLKQASDLAPRVTNLFREYLGRILMSGQRHLTAESLHELPAKLRATYQLWSEGHRMQELLSRATFYRHRKELQERGIDISITCDTENQSSNVVPLVRVLEARPAQIPAWAFDNKLIHVSAMRR
jgi:II/X family phage/plasmid replication protein